MRETIFNVYSERFGQIGKRIISGISWNLGATLFTQLSLFVVKIAIANILGKKVFGEYAIIFNTAITISAVAQFATGYTATKYLSEFRITDKERAGRILSVCLCVAFSFALISSIFMLFGAGWLAGTILKAPQLEKGLSIFSLYLFFIVLIGFLDGVLTGLEKFSHLCSVKIFGAVLTITFCLIGAFFWELNGVLTGLLGSVFIQALLLIYYSRKATLKFGINLSIEWGREKAVILSFALPAALAGFISMPSIWLANTLLVRQSNGLEEMGVFSAANSYRGLLLLFPLIVNKVGLSLLNNQKGKNDHNSFRKIFKINIALMGSSAIIGAIIISFIAPYILSIFGKDFSEGVFVLRILMLSTIFETFTVAFYQIIQSYEKMWQSLVYVSIPRDSLLILCSYFFVPRYGVNGLASSYAISWFVCLLLITLMSINVIKKKML